MGIGISGHRLAGSVAAQGGVGTLSSVDLRRHHPEAEQAYQEVRTLSDSRQFEDWLIRQRPTL